MGELRAMSREEGLRNGRMRRLGGFFGGTDLRPASPDVRGPSYHLDSALLFNLRYITSLLIVTEWLSGGGDVIPGRTEQLEMSSFPKQMNEASEMSQQLTQLTDALAE